ncbi:MAG: FGGY-family carbohydrate kinase, partial [Streptosporangiales bacterium]
IVESWRASGVLDEAFKRTGCTTFAGLPHAILRWLGEHDPDRIARSAAALTCGGWLFAALTGELAVDESEAAAPWLDVERREYDLTLLDMYGLPWARRLLPELRHDDQRVAPLLPAAATTLGLPRDTPVVLAPYDIASTAIGVGAVHPGQACGILGTTLCTETVTEQPDLAADPIGLTIPLGVPGRYVRAYPTLAGREVLDWAAGVLGLAGADDLCRLAASAPTGARGLAFLPYLSPAGERAPFLDPSARGSLEGLSTEHDRGCVARAVVEGLTYVIRECLRCAPVPPREIRLSGGGANSAEWCELIADVTGVPTRRTSGTEAGARGAYLTALVATGRERDHEAAVARCVNAADTFEPDADWSDRYAELFSSFLATRADASRGWSRLRQVRARLEEAGA